MQLPMLGSVSVFSLPVDMGKPFTRELKVSVFQIGALHRLNKSRSFIFGASDECKN